MREPDITIIIPAHNEEEGITDVINGIKRLNEGYEIIVVDDGSTDNTYKLAAETSVKVICHPYNKGYGAALKTGIRNAKADIVLFMDADGQRQPGDIKKIIQHIGEYDMVVGARTKKSKISLLRRPGKKILSITANYLAGMKIPDLNSGFRALKKGVALESTYKFKAERYDVGDTFGYVKAIVDFALEREDLKEKIGKYLRGIGKYK